METKIKDIYNRGRIECNHRWGTVFVEPGWTLTEHGLRAQYSGSYDEMLVKYNDAYMKGHGVSIFEGATCYVTETKKPVDINEINKPKTDRELLLEILDVLKGIQNDRNRET